MFTQSGWNKFGLMFRGVVVLLIVLICISAVFLPGINTGCSGRVTQKESPNTSPDTKASEGPVVTSPSVSSDQPKEAMDVKESPSVNTAVISISSTVTPVQLPSEGEILTSGNESAGESKLSQGEIEEVTVQDGEAGVTNTEFEKDVFNQVRLGMPLDEVIAVIGEPGMLVTQSTDGTMKLYRWERMGKVLYCRFEQDILTRSSVRGNETTEKELSRELYDQILEGMSLDEVTTLIGRPGRLVSEGADNQAVYLWSDRNGTSFSARFKDGKLVRKSGYYVKPKELPSRVPPEVIEEEKSAPEESSSDEEWIEGEEPNDENIVEEGTQTESVEGTSFEPSYEPTVNYPNRGVTTPIPRTTRANRNFRAENPVRVAFISRNSTGEGVGENEKPKISRMKQDLPRYTYQLKEGSYEIKIYNPMDEAVTVGIRSGKRGRNVVIPPRGEQSVKVPRGSYELYYLRGKGTGEVQQGGNIHIDGLFIGDVEVFLLR